MIPASYPRIAEDNPKKEYLYFCFNAMLIIGYVKRNLS